MDNTLFLEVSVQHAIGPLVSNGKQLNVTVLLEIRKRHDSQVMKNKGNELSKVHASWVIQQASTTSSDLTTKPSMCSKLVAVFWRESGKNQLSVSRLHRWNIQVNINLHEVAKNTTTARDLPEFVHFENAGLSSENKIEYAKFVILIKNNVSHPLVVH